MSRQNSINLAKHVDTSKMTFEGPLANNYGGKYAKVKHNGSWLLVQTPKIVCPFGVNVYEDVDKKTGKVVSKSYSMDLSFNGYQPDPESNSDEATKPKVKELYDMVQAMEDSLVKHACENSFTWVDDADASEAVCKALLRSGVKWSKDKTTKKINTKYAPRLKVNLPVWEDGMGFKAYVDNKTNEITDIDTLVKLASGRCEVVVIAECDKVTFNGGKYGFKWSVQQLKVYSGSSGMKTYAFIEDSDNEDDEDDDVLGEKQTSEQFVEDSDEEEDELDQAESSDEEESEEEETPPPKTTKKRVVKRKTKN